MKLFDPHIHMTSRTTDDYEAMAAAGIAAVVEPAFWLGQPRTHVGTFEDYFRRCSAGSASAPASSASATSARWRSTRRRPTTRGSPPGVLELLPRYLEKDGVVAVGEIGYDDMTPAEEKYFAAQLELARASTCRSSSTRPTATRSAAPSARSRWSGSVGFPEERVLIDHNTEETLPLVLATGCWAGHSIYPHTKMDEPRMVALVKRYGPERIIVNSAADWGVSDPLKVPKTVAAMREAGIAEADDRADRLGQPGRVLRPERPARPRGARGASPPSTSASCSRATRCCAARPPGHGASDGASRPGA